MKTKNRNSCTHGHSPKTHPECFKFGSDTSASNILFLDIETIYGVYRSWSRRPPKYFSKENMIKPWSIICWAAHKNGEKKVQGSSVTLKEVDERTQDSILGELWEALDWAHIVVTQNGKRFDVPKINTKFIEAGYSEPSYYFHVDLLQVAYKRFAFDFNDLESLAERLGVPHEKHEMSYGDWIACEEGTVKNRTKAMKKMLDYCKQDVHPLLSNVYFRMLPWIDNHPNMNLFTEADAELVCPNCGADHDNLYWGEEHFTPATAWKRFRCEKCGYIGRGTRKDSKIKGVTLK